MLKFILAGLWAAASSTGAAHYWYQQYKPFKDDAERMAALKDIIINESLFTSSWDKEEYTKFKKNPNLLLIEKCPDEDNAQVAPSINGEIYLFLPSKYLSLASHRKAFKNYVLEDAITFGHEGAHVTQGLNNLLFWMGNIFLKKACSLVDSTYITPSAEEHFKKPSLTEVLLQMLGSRHLRITNPAHYIKVTFNENINLHEALLNNSFAVSAHPLVEKNTLSQDEKFKMLVQNVHSACKEYIRAHGELEHLYTLFQSSAHIERDKETCHKHLVNAGKRTLKKMVTLVSALTTARRYAEIDADKQAIKVVLSSDLTHQDKINALSSFKDILTPYCANNHSTYTLPLCEQTNSSHPPCKARIALLEQAKQELKPLAALEYGSQTMQSSGAFGILSDMSGI